MEQTGKWAVIGYTLPREPSRVRVSLWRKLKKRGAVSIQQSMWVLPHSGGNDRFFSGLKMRSCATAARRSYD